MNKFNLVMTFILLAIMIRVIMRNNSENFQTNSQVALNNATLSYGNVPPGTIVSWCHDGTLDSLLRLQHNSNTNIPDGWVMCDGRSYLKTDGTTTGYTPNLVGKFIYGAKGVDNYANITEDNNQIWTNQTAEQEYKSGNASDRGVYEMYKANGTHDMGDTNNAPMSMSGNRMVTLTEEEMPRHTHSGTTEDPHWPALSTNQYMSGALSKPPPPGPGPDNFFGGPQGNSYPHRHAFITDPTGGSNTSPHNTVAHENMPPYYRLVYIMKKY